MTAKKSRWSYESMTRVLVGPFVVRVWCEVKPSEVIEFYAGDPKVREALHFERVAGTRDIIDRLKKLDHVYAFEITVADGSGGVAYRDWPK